MATTALERSTATPREPLRLIRIVTLEEWNVMEINFLEMWKIACCSRDPPESKLKMRQDSIEKQYVQMMETTDGSAKEEFERLRRNLYQIPRLEGWHKLPNASRVQFTSYFIQTNRNFKVPLKRVEREVYSDRTPPLMKRLWEQIYTPTGSPKRTPTIGTPQAPELTLNKDRLPQPNQFPGYSATQYVTKISDRAMEMLNPSITDRAQTAVYLNNLGHYAKMLDKEAKELLKKYKDKI